MEIKKFLGKSAISRKDKLLALIGKGSSQATLENNKSFLGRTRLVKAFFLAQYLDYEKEESRLDTDIGFSNYEFFIYSHGPFSTELMEDLEKLRDSGLIIETESSSGNRFRLTEKGEEKFREIENNLNPEDLNRIEKISEIIAGKNGEDLEEKSLNLLGIKGEKQDWIGFKVEKVIQGINPNRDSDTSQESLPIS